jgi:hypothetical protein
MGLATASVVEAVVGRESLSALETEGVDQRRGSLSGVSIGFESSREGKWIRPGICCDLCSVPAVDVVIDPRP